MLKFTFVSVTLAQHIESIIFVSEQPVDIDNIQHCLKSLLDNVIEESEILEHIKLLQDKYEDPEFSIEIVRINNGYQFLTKGAYHATVAAYLKQITQKRLSRTALETLSIVAYKQPVTKPEVESIRGVNCDYAIQKLLDKELISIIGRSEGPGRPLLYGTSERFMNYFGLGSLTDLPTPKDFGQVENSIGENDRPIQTVSTEEE